MAIVTSLGLFYVVEWILWVPLQINKMVRRALGRPTRKAVNPPELEWKAS